MIGIGLGILWLGYAAFATGYAAAKGIPFVTFSDMVLPKNRANTLAILKAGKAGAGIGTSQLGSGPGITDFLNSPQGQAYLQGVAKQHTAGGSNLP